MTIIRIGLDTSKHVFRLHGVDETEAPALRRQLRRAEVERFVVKLPPARIGIEACGARITGAGCCARSGTRWC
jgi:transposase